MIGFAEALSAPEVVWSLVDAGFSVRAIARKGRASALRHSRHVDLLEICAPESDIQESLKQLHSTLQCIAEDAQTPIVILSLDDSFLRLADQLTPSTSWVVAGPEGVAVRFALDKKMQCQVATDAGLSVPEVTFIEGGAEFQKLDLQFPVIVRPSMANEQQQNRLKKGRNIICCNEKEQQRAAASMDNGAAMVQPYITGTGEGIFGFATGNGVVAWSAHRRVRMMNPHGSGSSACAVSEVSEEITTRIEVMVKSVGWRGMFMVEMLRDERGKLWFIEFNGRAWGSMALARRQKLEYPAWNAALALEPSFRPPAIASTNRKLECRNIGRELMHLLFVLRGAKTQAIQNWPSFWRAFFRVLTFRRRRNWYNWRNDDWRVFFADGFYTLRDNLFKRN